MQNIGFHFPDTLGAALGWMLLHLLWQATLIGIAAGIALLLMRRRPARLRYWIANAALAAVLCAAFGTFLFYYGSAGLDQGAGARTPVTAGIAAPPATQIHLAREAATLDNAGLYEYFDRQLPAIVALWFLGMSLFLLRLLGNIGYAHYLKTHLNFPADPYWQNLLDQLAQKTGLGKTVGLVESALARTPMVVGHLKPVILFPIGMINRLDPAEAEAILAHELAHILRHDYLFNILQSIVETLFYFHPAVWWLSGVVRHEREIAADDAAIRCTGNALAYAKALVLVQELALTPPALAPAFAGPRKNRLLRRIQHILNIQQSKNLAMEKFIGVCAILLVILGIGFTQTKTNPTIAGPAIPAAQPVQAVNGLSGAWQGTIENDQVCMSLVSRSPESSWMNGACFKTSEFSALPTTEADFTLTRPAGTITFRGKFEGKEGYGRFSFAPDQAFNGWLAQQGITGLDDNQMVHLFFANVGKDYVESLKKAGYNNLNGEDLSRLAIHEVSREDIAGYRDLAKELGQNELSIDDLLNLKIHGVDREYVSSLKKAGFNKLDLEIVQNAKIHELTPEFIRQCRDLGFSNMDLDEIMNFKIHEITPEYVQQCRNMGFSNLNAEDMMNFKIHEVTPEYLDDLKKAGLASLSAEDVLNLRIQNVTPASISELRKMGFGELSAEEIANLHIHEVTPAFLNQMQQIGFKNLSADEAMNLKIHGIDGDFVRSMNKAGFENLSVDEVINCRIHEVTAEQVQAFAKLGFSKISVEDAISTKIHEVTPAFIQTMREKGFKNMSLEEYIQLKVQYGEKMK